jgi:putative DNA primase/helicase
MSTATIEIVEAIEECMRANVVGGEVLPLTDLGNAERFERLYAGRFVHTQATGWLVYINGRWQLDKTSRVKRAMQNTVRSIEEEREFVKDDKLKDIILGWSKKSEAAAKMSAALEVATSLRSFAKDYADFDRHPELLNCGNGTYNLEAGTFGPHDPDHLLTKGTDIRYDAQADCPQWERFLLDIMDGKPHLRKYLARAGGYTISAETGEQCLFVPWGFGGTGKSTFLSVMAGVMGDYCSTADPEMFMAKRGDAGQPFELAGMEGVRALFAIETEEGKQLAQAKVKRMTGQDPVVACRKFQHQYSFVPSWKIWLATNDKPRVNATDDALWDRVKLIPFEVRFRGTDRQVENLAEKLLKEESSGILNWFIHGYQMWAKDGLQHPEEVSLAVGEWRQNEDYFGRFLEERTEPSKVVSEYASSKAMFEQFDRWSEDNKEARNINNTQFNEMMRKKGHRVEPRKVEGRSVKVWIGLKLVSSMGSSYTNQMSDVENL